MTYRSTVKPIPKRKCLTCGERFRPWLPDQFSCFKCNDKKGLIAKAWAIAHQESEAQVRAVERPGQSAQDKKESQS